MMLCLTLAAPPPGNDVELDGWIARIAEGDRAALAALYRQTRSAVYGFALSILKNPQDAEDVLQDAYLQVWQAAGGYRGSGKPMAWLLTIARNLSIDRLRQQSRTLPLDLQEQPDDASPVTEEDRMTLHALLETLGDQERQIVTLHALTGLKHREIAALLSMPLPTVLSKYNRALKKLRTAWKEAD